MRRISSLLLIFLLVLFTRDLQAQITTGQLTGEINTVESAVPFLTIAPDSRAGAMGDAGVATSADVNSMHWNPAKYAFIESQAGVAVSYTPWLRNLVNDIDLLYLSGFYRLDQEQVVAASLLYFSLGDIEFINEYATYINTYTPNEFAVDVAYSRLFSEYFSGGVAFRYIRSDLSGQLSSSGGEGKPGWAFAADISAFYTRDIELSGRDATMAYGVNISNIGNKISYSDDQQKDFLPINLRLGGALTTNMDDYNAFTFALDFNKLLVPTRPQYDGDRNIIAGKDPDVPVISGIFQSFYDAPGVVRADGTRNVLLEEVHEITYSAGVEYLYRNQFAIRGGYFHEHATKGNRKFFTLGVGLKMNVVSFDFSYLLPTNASNPLANTLRFTIGLDFNQFRNLR